MQSYTSVRLISRHHTKSPSRIYCSPLSNMASSFSFNSSFCSRSHSANFNRIRLSFSESSPTTFFKSCLDGTYLFLAVGTDLVVIVGSSNGTLTSSSSALESHRGKFSSGFCRAGRYAPAFSSACVHGVPVWSRSG